MAGDWLKVEKATARKPEVLRIASTLGIHPDHAFGLCFNFWCWCDENSRNGSVTLLSHSRHAVSQLIDAIVSHQGFCESLISVGWMEEISGSIVIPNFDRHMGKSSKTRIDNALRQRRHRNGNVTKKRDTCHKKALPEKRREEKSKDSLSENLNNPLPPELDSDAFRQTWQLWLAYRREKNLPKYKPIGLSATLKELVELGQAGAIEAIKRSIAKNWQGIHPDKPNGKQQQRLDNSPSKYDAPGAGTF